MTKKLKNISLKQVVSPDRIKAKQLKNVVLGDAEIAISGTPDFVKNYVEVLTKELSVDPSRIKNYIQKPKMGGGYDN